MARQYIIGDEARITKSEFNRVDLEFIDGCKHQSLEPRRLFPLSGLTKYISLLDEEGHEVAIIRDLDTIMPDCRKVIEQSLAEYYLIPKISAITERKEKYGTLSWTVETDRGVRSFRIKRNKDIKVLFDGRVLVRDSDDNRYEIPSVAKLDKKSLQLLYSDI